jgi:hypothetical protein
MKNYSKRFKILQGWPGEILYGCQIYKATTDEIPPISASMIDMKAKSTDNTYRVQEAQLASAKEVKNVMPLLLFSPRLRHSPKSQVTHAQPHAALVIWTSIYRGSVGDGRADVKSLILFANCLEER